MIGIQYQLKLEVICAKNYLFSKYTEWICACQNNLLLLLWFGNSNEYLIQMSNSVINHVLPILFVTWSISVWISILTLQGHGRGAKPSKHVFIISFMKLSSMKSGLWNGFNWKKTPTLEYVMIISWLVFKLLMCVNCYIVYFSNVWWREIVWKGISLSWHLRLG